MKLETRVLIYRLAGALGLILFIFGFLNQFFLFPLIVKSLIKKDVALKNGWPMRKIWSKLPFPYETHFYVFNTTNPDEIENGIKPIMKEYGPYVYDVWQEKVNQEDREEDDTLSYSVRRIHHFNKFKSNGLSEDDEFVFPEFLRVSAGSGFNRYNPAFVFAGAKAIDVIYNNPDSIFVKRPVKTLLFDGLPMPCKGITNYFGKSACNQFVEFKLRYNLREVDGTYYSSIWGHFNGTYNERERKIRIHRGIKNLKEIGQVVEYEELPDFVTWNNDSYCDSFHGSDGTILRPFLNSKGKDKIEIVNILVCRSLVYHYDSTVVFDGLPLLRYTTHFGVDVDKNPNEICFCTRPESCLKPGVLDLLLCTYVPWVGSHPHFYLADQSYVDAVDGVHPDKEKHMMIIDVDPLTGIIVRSHMRIQYNMEFSSLKKYKLMKNFPNALLPMVWVDEIIVLPHFLIKKIKDRHNMIVLSRIILYLTTISGFVICGIVGHYEYKSRRANKQCPVKVVLQPPTPNNGLSRKN